MQKGREGNEGKEQKGKKRRKEGKGAIWVKRKISMHQLRMCKFYFFFFPPTVLTTSKRIVRTDRKDPGVRCEVYIAMPPVT